MLPVDKNNPEDVDTHASDHAYDALRYMIMSPTVLHQFVTCTPHHIQQLLYYC